jgi:hypothetical protein
LSNCARWQAPQWQLPWPCHSLSGSYVDCSSTQRPQHISTAPLVSCHGCHSWFQPHAVLSAAV